MDKARYDATVKEVILFLRGQDSELISHLTAEMEEEALQLHFERAAVIRDQIASIRQTLEKQKIITTRFIDREAIACFRQDNALEVFFLFIRQGRMVGNQSFSFRHVALEDDEVLSSFITQFYGDGKFIPDEVLVPLDLEARCQEGLERILDQYRRLSSSLPFCLTCN